MSTKCARKPVVLLAASDVQLVHIISELAFIAPFQNFATFNSAVHRSTNYRSVRELRLKRFTAALSFTQCGSTLTSFGSCPTDPPLPIISWFSVEHCLNFLTASESTMGIVDGNNEKSSCVEGIRREELLSLLGYT